MVVSGVHEEVGNPEAGQDPGRGQPRKPTPDNHHLGFHQMASSRIRRFTSVISRFTSIPLGQASVQLWAFRQRYIPSLSQPLTRSANPRGNWEPRQGQQSQCIGHWPSIRGNASAGSTWGYKGYCTCGKGLLNLT
ncbi:hypothetical protein Thermus77412_19350 [Thermus antranikianii]